MNENSGQIIDLAAIAAQAQATDIPGAAWSLATGELNLNLVRFARGDGVEAHVNNEVDVVAIVVAGEGIVEIGERRELVHAGQLFYMPKGVQRAMHATEDGEFAYVTCHRRRAGLMPTRARRT